MLVGLSVSDDAAVYRIDENTAVIQTIDFFTPVVDNPYDYGAIAAANAMSDVYAMGGRVVLALNVCAFPPELPNEVKQEILRGGTDRVAEAGGVVAGGHTVDDKEPKYGLSVMGLVHPDKILRKRGAKPGDILVLTKPLGTGVITTAGKRGRAESVHIEKATAWMKELNRGASEVFLEIGAHACTDISGFSFLGHACELAEKSGVGLKIDAGAVSLIEGALSYAKQGMFPGGTHKNKKAYSAGIHFSGEIPENLQLLFFTPETSGGLLAAIDKESISICKRLFKDNNIPLHIIGTVTEKGACQIEVE